MRISDWSSDVCSSDLYGARILEFVDKQQVEFVGQRRGDCGIVERPEQQRFLIREVENTQFALALRIRPQRCGSAFKTEPDVVTQIDVQPWMLQMVLGDFANGYGETIQRLSGIHAGNLRPRRRTDEHTSALQSLIRISS